VLMHHYDFDHQLSLPGIGVDLSLSGHIHSDNDDTTYPMDVVTDNASGSNRPFRLIRFDGTTIAPRPTLSAQDDDRLRVTYSPANDGTNDEVIARLINGHAEAFHHALLRVSMPTAQGYLVTGGTLVQVDATSDPVVCYVEVDAAANTVSTVAVEVDTTIGSTPPPPAPSLSVHPNPFNPHTQITIELGTPQMCRLTVFDLRGRTLTVLADGLREAGHHVLTWDGTDAQGNALASGTYLLGLHAGAYGETRKIMLVR